MSIRLNSNILSLNAQRRLGESTTQLSQTFTRLSSGLRITRASDDAAGLAISENLKTDARLSNQAIRNVNDGVSMISIINNALDAQKQILYRMAEIAEQSSNGVMSQQQRNPLHEEYMTLLQEFDRIASSAEFNGISLLRNPDQETVNLMAGITGASSSLLSFVAANSHQFAGTTGYLVDWANDDGVFNEDDLNELGTALLFPQLFPSFDSALINNPEAPEKTQTMGIQKVTDSTGRELEIWFFISTADGETIGSATPKMVAVVYDKSRSPADPFIGSIDLENINENTTNEYQVTLSDNGATVNFSVDFSSLNFVKYDEDPNAKATAIGFTNVRNQSSALSALDTVKNKIEEVSRIQGEFGAIESRLGVAGNLLSVNSENYTSAASQITDIDVAIEAANLMRVQILQRSAVSILSQANQQPSLALQLLSGIKK